MTGVQTCALPISVLNRVRAGTQYYLQKRSLLVRAPQGGGPEGGGMRKLARGELLETFEVTFGIPEPLARAALDIVSAKDPDFFRK